MGASECLIIYRFSLLQHLEIFRTKLGTLEETGSPALREQFSNQIGEYRWAQSAQFSLGVSNIQNLTAHSDSLGDL